MGRKKMKVRYNKKFIRFVEIQEDLIEVRNKKGDYLGTIRYAPKWKKFAFNPDKDTYFDSICLIGISDKLREMDLIKRDNKNEI